MLSRRIQKIEESGIRKIFDLATKNKGEFVNLSIGQPHFQVSDNIKKTINKAIKENCNAYSPTAGIPALREKIADKLNRKNNIPAKLEDIIITAGVSGALFLAFSAILDPEDEIILPDPYFVLYKQILNFLEVKIKYLDTYPDFHLDAKKLEKLITKNTKAIIINSPNNPTGAIYSKNELEKIAKIAQKNNLIIISDEIYEEFDYDNKFFSIGSIYEKTITLNGFSKSHSITGWRLGYAHGPSKIISAMNKLQQYTFVCASTPAQFALARGENINPDEKIKNYKEKRDYLYKNLKDKYELNIPEGAFYAFIKNPSEEKNFTKKLIKNKLLAVPGNVFSEKNDYFRISFAVNDKELQKGIKILKKMA